MSIEVIVALATALGLGGLLQTIYSSFSQRRKVGADAAKEITAAAVELLSPLRQELALERAEAKADAAEATRVNAKARADMDKVVAQLEVCQRKVTRLGEELDIMHQRNQELESLSAELDAAKRRNLELELLLGKQ